MDKKIKELIAVGASVAANCQPCLQYHVSKALKSEVDEQEIKEAIEVGKMVRKGANSNMDKYASSLKQTPSSTPDATNASCACCS